MRTRICGLSLSFALLALSTVAAADTGTQAVSPADELASVQVTVRDLTAEAPQFYQPMDAGSGLGEVVSGLDQIILVVDKVIAIGEKIWKIIEANRPVVNVDSKVISVLPNNPGTWDTMAGWSPIQTKEVAIKITNSIPFYPWTMVDLKYRLTYQYGGSVQGNGRYLANIRVTPEINVMPTVNVTSEVLFDTPQNIGKVGETPVAGIPITIITRIQGKLNSMVISKSFFVTGNGLFTQTQ